MGNLFDRFESKPVPTTADMECCAGIAKRFAKAEMRPKSGDYDYGRGPGSISRNAIQGKAAFADYDPDGFSIPQF